MTTAVRLVLGVDGGGSKTEAWLAECYPGQAPNILGRGRGGSSNGRSVGMDVAAVNLQTAIDAAFHNAGRERCRVASACLAMAGADREVEKEHFGRWADQAELAERTVIVNDAIPVIYAALDDAVGVALISGTGSMAIGRSADGKVERCGGWGGMFGDEGSGYAIATAVLRAASRVEDGRGPATALRQTLVDHLGSATLMDAVPSLCDPSIGRATIASLAPLVFEVASSGDEVAEQILEQAASDLSQLVVTLCRRLSLDAMSLPLALAGSVLLNQRGMVDRLCGYLEQAGIRPNPIAPVHHPVQGAVEMACRRLI